MQPQRAVSRNVKASLSFERSKDHIRERIRKQLWHKRDSLRATRMSDLRSAGEGADSSSLAVAEHRFAAEGHLSVDNWSEVVAGFDVDCTDAATLQHLLAMEEEIRQEALVTLYEQANEAVDWDEYYRSLMS
ncbi:hypothetical protein STCU_04077 [Strigomonas culicis]|uniref:Uncharacterized protein n=1 Tax=Strigomonas culicis TaxID=28005 RepID=S9VTD8_9TRYP|nr:hypothetical protein STCU_04077 [Strigomonas culicis]|eukprot:EPY30416.1 hypothetical protein STCU_04077 [Strigomonas culicis]